MEASALNAPASLSRLPLGASLLRLRSDEQLLALFRSGHDEAFRVLHDRYRQRLFAYVRQMLSATSRQDAEDVLQDVFVRAYGALRNDNREMNVRAWLYRVAHNRCIDHLRRPIPPAAELFEVSRKPLHDPVEEAQRRDDLRQLVHDVGNLPEQQRSALLMREIDGMTYADLAVALDVTVPAVKSLLVRARSGLADAAQARDTDCARIREELALAVDRPGRPPRLLRDHLRVCESCRAHRQALRHRHAQLASLLPGPSGLLLGGWLAGMLGTAGGGASSAVTGSALVAGATKTLAVASASMAVAGGAVEVAEHRPQPEPRPQPTAALVIPAPDDRRTFESRNRVSYSGMADATRRELETYYAEPNRRLEARLGRSLGW